MKDKNEAIVSGKILYLYHPQQERLIVRIKAKKNNPAVFVCGALAEHIWHHYKIHDRIVLKCNLQHSEKKGKQVMTIFGEQILTDCIESQCSFRINGKVLKKVQKENGISILYVLTHTKYKSITPVTLYYPADQIQVGDEIKISGEIQTNKKMVNDTAIFYTNFVLKNYRIVA